MNVLGMNCGTQRRTIPLRERAVPGMSHLDGHADLHTITVDRNVSQS